MRRVAIVVFALAALAACSVFGAKDDSSPPAASATDAGDGGDGSVGILSGPAVTIAMSPQASSIALDDDTVYWTDSVDGVVRAAPKAGGDRRDVAGGTEKPDDVAVDADNVYWVEVRSGCPAHNHVLSHPKNQTGAASPIWPNDNNCYTTWRMAYASGPGFFYVQQDATIVTLAKNGTRTQVAGNEMIITDLAGDGDAVFWTADNSIRTVPSGGGATSFADNVMTPGAIALDLDAVYAVDGSGTIERFDRSNGKAIPQKLATGETGVQHLALDSDNVYWTNKTDHTVKTVPKKGGDVRVLASEQDGPNAIAVDASGVYWSNVGVGTINAIRR